MALFEGTAIWISKTIVDIIDYTISHSMPLLEPFSRNKFVIYMMIGRQA